MSDPLQALKNAIKSKSPIEYPHNETQITIGDNTFPKSSPTRYRKAGARSDFYSLEAVYLAWLLRDATGAEYMKQAREHGLAVGFVSVTERKHVVDWLEGRTADQDRVAPLSSADSTTPPGTPPRSTEQALPVTPRSRAEAPTTSPTKRRYVPDAHDLEIVKKIRQNEVELHDRNTVLKGQKPNNFSAVRTAYGEKLKKMKESNRAATSSTPATPAVDPKMLARKARHTQPIIMISSSPTALITMHNVKRFLEDSTFEPSQDARARATAEGNLRPEDLIPIYRKRTMIDASGKETVIKSTYFVVDSVEALNKFGPDCWDRVVCVMTTGQAWQFRPYKWSEPRQLFHNVKGIYVTWSNDPPNPKIKDWNVTELKLDYDAYTYLAITLSASSPFFTSPPALVARHPGLALNYVGQAGGLSDVHLYSMPKSEFLKRGGSTSDVEGMVLQDLQGSDGVLYVQVQVPGQRIKRAAEDL